MKRFFVFLFCFVIMTTLCSCSENETANIALFSERYNAQNVEKLSYQMMSAAERGSTTEYSFVASCDESGGKIVLAKLLADENGRLFECRLVIARTDGQNKVTLLESDIDRFVESCERVLSAFSGFDSKKSENLISALEIRKSLSSQCEKTARENEYYCVFLSNEICYEIIMDNTYLKKIEETQKPESRAVYDKTTNIRTETVLHK